MFATMETEKQTLLGVLRMSAVCQPPCPSFSNHFECGKRPRMKQLQSGVEHTQSPGGHGHTALTNKAPVPPDNWFQYSECDYTKDDDTQIACYNSISYKRRLFTMSITPATTGVFQDQIVSPLHTWGSTNPDDTNL